MITKRGNIILAIFTLLALAVFLWWRKLTIRQRARRARATLSVLVGYLRRAEDAGYPVVSAEAMGF